MGFSTSAVSSDGLVNQDAVDSYIPTLLSKMGAVAPKDLSYTNLNPASEYATKSAALRASIQEEYCFYYSRYMYVLQSVLMTAAATDKVVGSQSDYLAKKEYAQTLNMKLNQILQVMQGLIRSRSASLTDYYGTGTGVNALNAELDATRESLVRHMGKLQNQDMEKDIKAAMIDFSLEKNSSSRNMLAIYGFMNIVALGLLVYLYRSR